MAADPIRFIMTTPGDWGPLRAVPSGWKIRRLGRSQQHATYVVFDATCLDCVLWLTPPPAATARAMRKLGYRLAGICEHTHVWTRRVARPATSPATPAVA